jgi:hypothetical protein
MTALSLNPVSATTSELLLLMMMLRFSFMLYLFLGPLGENEHGL